VALSPEPGDEAPVSREPTQTRLDEISLHVHGRNGIDPWQPTPEVLSIGVDQSVQLFGVMGLEHAQLGVIADLSAEHGCLLAKDD
jgi:hypothetical protein